MKVKLYIIVITMIAESITSDYVKKKETKKVVVHALSLGVPLG